MTTNDIDAIRKLTDAATPGPWKLITDFCDCGGEYGCSHGEFPYGFGPFPQAEHDGTERTYDDFEFAAAARTLVPALCDEVEQLRATLTVARERVAADIERMDHDLGDDGWAWLMEKAEGAGYPAHLVRRRRTRLNFTTATIEMAYQYGYRQAARVARGEVAR